VAWFHPRSDTYWTHRLIRVSWDDVITQRGASCVVSCPYQPTAWSTSTDEQWLFITPATTLQGLPLVSSTLFSAQPEPFCHECNPTQRTPTRPNSSQLIPAHPNSSELFPTHPNSPQLIPPHPCKGAGKLSAERWTSGWPPATECVIHLTAAVASTVVMKLTPMRSFPQSLTQRQVSSHLPTTGPSTCICRALIHFALPILCHSSLRSSTYFQGMR